MTCHGRLKKQATDYDPLMTDDARRLEVHDGEGRTDRRTDRQTDTDRDRSMSILLVLLAPLVPLVLVMLVVPVVPSGLLVLLAPPALQAPAVRAAHDRPESAGCRLAVS